MKDTFVDVAVFLGNRRSKRNRIRFINYFRNIYNDKKIFTEIIHFKEKMSESFHFVVGDLKKAKRVIVAPLDTGSKMLIPWYRYYPADSKSNFASEILNTTVYIVLSLVVILIMLLMNRNFNSYQLIVKVLLVVLDFVLAFIAFNLIRNLDNKHNYNRNSQSIALMISNSLKNSKDVAYVFADQTVMMNLGYQQLQKNMENKEVLILDCLGTADEQLYLITGEDNSNMADSNKSVFESEVILLNKEQTDNSPLRYFKKGMILTSGTIERNKLAVVNTRTSKDQKLDLKHLNRLNDFLSKYIDFKK